jgi:gamma-glutamyltranspeptidase
VIDRQRNMVSLTDTAVKAPRLHTEWDDLWVDDRVGPAKIAALQKMGHLIVPKTMTFRAFFFARPVAIRITKQGLRAGLDPWSDASAAGI